ncbi:hypothetical protein EI94DRAFT_1340720 [Lactarius quietus]|nr:hypothetical protein EI94DRAFT_1340720 [Lactarius quietus]
MDCQFLTLGLFQSFIASADPTFSFRTDFFSGFYPRRSSITLVPRTSESRPWSTWSFEITDNPTPRFLLHLFITPLLLLPQAISSQIRRATNPLTISLARMVTSYGTFPSFNPFLGSTKLSSEETLCSKPILAFSPVRPAPT